MTNSSIKPPVWFWILAIIGLIWNSLGIHGYLSQVYNTEAFTKAYSQEQIDIISNFPSWYTGLFAIAVFTGALGCLMLLLKKKVANILLIVSFIAATIQMSYFLFIADLKNVDFNANKIMAITIIIFAAILIWFSKHSVKKAWIS